MINEPSSAAHALGIAVDYVGWMQAELKRD